MNHLPSDLPLLVVYGSLRRGWWNYNALLTDSRMVQHGDKLSGYSMRHNGGFPAIFEADESSVVEVDVIDLSVCERPEMVLAAIDRMERGCGYRSRTVTTQGGHVGQVYYMPGDSVYRFPHPVDDGNWNNLSEER